MSTDDEFFTPEHVDEQIDFLSHKRSQNLPATLPAARIISYLRQFYRKSEQKQIDPLERAWKRIIDTHKLIQPHLQEEGQILSMQDFPKEREKPGYVQNPQRVSPASRRRSLIQRLGVLAAVVFLCTLIGGMVLILNASKNGAPRVQPDPTSQLGSGGTPQPTPPHPITGGKCSLDTHKTAPRKSSTSVPGLYIFGFYAPSSNLLYRYDPQTKKVIWSKKFCSLFESNGPVEQNGVLYFVGIDETHESGSGRVSYLYALNESDGSVIWGVQFPSKVIPYPKSQGEASPIDLGAVRTPAIVNGIVYAIQDSGIVYAFDSATGGQLWTFDSGATAWGGSGSGMIFPSSIQVVNNIAYFTIDNRIIAINAQTGAKLWVNILKQGQIIDSTPAIANNTVYVTAHTSSNGGTVSPKGALYAFDAQNGSQKWVNDHFKGPPSDPYSYGDKVYVGANATWYTINPVDGSLEAQRALSVIIWPILLDGTFYLINDTTLAAMNADGSIRWSVPTTGKYPAIRDLKNGIIYIDARGSGVYTYRASDGKFLWHYGGYLMQPDSWSAITAIP